MILLLIVSLVSGVEDVVSDSGVEENIALVTFGGTSNIVQHLTNDFSRVRDAIGRSMFILLCLLCFTSSHMIKIII